MAAPELRDACLHDSAGPLRRPCVCITNDVVTRNGSFNVCKLAIGSGRRNFLKTDNVAYRDLAECHLGSMPD